MKTETVDVRIATKKEVEQAVELYPEMVCPEGAIIVRFGADGVAAVQLDEEDPTSGWLLCGSTTGEGLEALEFDAMGFKLREPDALGLAAALLNDDPDSWYCRESAQGW